MSTTAVSNTPGEESKNAIERVLDAHFSPKQIAERLGLSEMTVIRIFQDEPGVFKLKRGLGGKKRQYVILRIPESVLIRVIEARSR